MAHNLLGVITTSKHNPLLGWVAVLIIACCYS